MTRIHLDSALQGEQTSSYPATERRQFAPPTRLLMSVDVMAPDGEVAWPIHLKVALRAGTYLATQLSPSGITLTGPKPLAVNWLTEIVIHSGATPLTMLANITRCEPTAGGGFEITAQPFALAGEVKAAWLRLIFDTRYQSELTQPISRVVAR